MRHVLATLAAIAGAALTAGAADDEKYKSAEGKFAIQFPAGGKVKTDTRKAGKADMRIASVEAGGGNYAVMYMDLPAEAKNVPAKTILDAGEKGGAGRTGGKTEATKDIEFGKEKYPGREVVVDVNGSKMKSRMILAEARLYVLVVEGPKDFVTTKDAAKFLDSFEITK